MLVVDTIARIRREHFVKGKTIKEIARDLGVSRNTVRRVLRSGAALSVTSGVNFTENHRFEIRCFLAITATPSLHVEVLSPDWRRGEMPANVALGGRVWSGGNPL